MCALKNNEYLKTMKPMLYLMKLICALPIGLKSQNTLPYFISSSIVTWILTAIYLIIQVRSVGRLIYVLFFDKDILFDVVMAVARGPGMLLQLYGAFAPVLLWNRGNQIQNYWDAWGHLQFKYEAIDGAPYVSKKRRAVKIAAIICITWISLRCLYAAWLNYYIWNGIYPFIVNAYFLFEVFVISIYWFCNYAYSWSMSEDIMNLGKRIISKKKDDEKLNQLISLWSALNDLTKHFNETHSFLYLFFFALIMVAIVTYSYALLHYSTYKTVFPFTFYLNSVLYFVIFLLLICVPAHLVYEQTQCRQKEALLLENTTEMDPSTLKFVSRYLQTISVQDSAIALNGFFSIKRINFSVILFFSIDYLIVVRQFSKE